jgi:hypothetical protein
MSENLMKNSKLRVRILLLALHILLPFGLYFTMKMENGPLAVLIAALLGLSMLVLVWLG